MTDQDSISNALLTVPWPDNPPENPPEGDRSVNDSLGPATQHFMNQSWDGENEYQGQANNNFGTATQDFMNDSWDEDDWSDGGFDLGQGSQAFMDEPWVEQEGGALLDHFAITALFEQAVPHLGTVGRAFKISFFDLDTVACIHTLFYEALVQLVQRAFAEADDQDLVGAEIRHPGLRLPIQIPFRPRAQLDVDVIWEYILAVLQSNQDFALDESLVMQSTIIANPQGGARRNTRFHMDDWLKDREQHRSCLIRINNTDQLCLPRAIVTGIAKHVSDRSEASKTAWNNIRRGDKDRRTQQRVQALELMAKAGLSNHKGPCGHAELNALQQAVSPIYRLRVINAENMLTVTYDGSDEGLYINLLLHKHHYDLILSMPAFYQRSYYCDFCKKAYNNMDQHTTCGHRCPCCFAVDPCSVDGNMLFCVDCRRWFANDQCMTNHKAIREQSVSKEGEPTVTRTSTCLNVRRCDGCGKTLYPSRKKKDKDHQCGMTECRFCKETVDASEHRCYMQPIVEDKKKKKTVQSYLYYDFETSQDQEVGANTEGLMFKHVVNCVCMSKSCHSCFGSDTHFCTNCGIRRRVYLGKTALDDFCRFMFSKANKDVVAMAHNASGYDGQFVLDYLQRQSIAPEMIGRGLSIVRLEACHVLLLDSMSFIPMGLAALAKAFGLSTQKGYFPHYFNTMAHWHYEGPIPDAWYYGPGSMKKEARDDFYVWYNAQSKTDPWNLQKQLVYYCQLDVTILEAGCMKFRRLLLDQFNVDPYTSASTIPGTCMYIYRKNFMELQSIAIVPHGGYRKNDKHSIIAIKWLKWISEKESISIQHAENGKEIRIGRWKVDGQCRYNKLQIFEFYGCAYHGCPTCFPNRSNRLPKSDLTAAEAYQSTLDRQRELEQQKYTVRTMWECDLHRRLKHDPEMAEFFKHIEMYDPLEPRDAFFGGRTNATRLYCKVSAAQMIYYMDVCSLYPWVCKYAAFPRGHPTIITEGFKPIDKDHHPYKGLIKCLVLPPRSLYHPVLPYRSGGKLVFPLCSTCADERWQGDCQHNDADRRMWGTWTHVELYHALERGYTVLKVAEVYHWTEWCQYDGVDESTGMFTAYINAFLKIKQEASGWPKWAVTDEQKTEYIRLYKEKEGIDLEWDKIEFNPALRTLAKLCLNSFWGKFGQRCKLSKTEFFTEIEPYCNVVFNAANEVTSARIVNSAMVAVGYSKADDYVDEQQYTNPVIAAYVTANARLKLLSYLEPLGTNCLYYDTDSVIFVHSKGEFMPPTGDYLGDLTDELGGDHIVEFVSGGPKVYGYRTNRGHTTVKIRGITLNATTSNKLNFKSLKSQVAHFIRTGDRGQTDVVMSRIVKTAERTVQTRTMRKQYRVAYDKRRVMGDGTTLPYGY